MSRPPRSGTAGRNVTIRATDEERIRWERGAKLARATLSTWIRRAIERQCDCIERAHGIAGGNTMENTASDRRNPRRAKR